MIYLGAVGFFDDPNCIHYSTQKLISQHFFNIFYENQRNPTPGE